MWIIKCDDIVIHNQNKKSDDFFQFMPKYFSKKLNREVLPIEVEAWWCDEEFFFKKYDEINLTATKMDVYKKEKDGTKTKVKNLSLKKMGSWPYTEADYVREIQVPEKDEETGLVLKDAKGNPLYKKVMRNVLDDDGNQVRIIKHVKNNGIT